MPEGSRKRSCRPSTRGRNGRIDRYLRIIENGLGAGARAERPGCGTPLLTTFTMFHSVASHGIFPRRIRSSRRKARMQPPPCRYAPPQTATWRRIHRREHGQPRARQRKLTFESWLIPLWSLSCTAGRHNAGICEKHVDTLFLSTLMSIALGGIPLCGIV